MVSMAAAGSGATKAKIVKIKGVVQGVGFRPFVYQLAHRLGLKGWVLNDAQGVTIHWEGNQTQLDSAMKSVVAEAPPLAKITEYTITDAAVFNYASFYIQESIATADKEVLISPDTAPCAHCQQEFNDTKDARFQYPFINCTNCGPRFTIVQDRPYDRQLTSMSWFQMCPNCHREYEDPSNRRFHAQPNCCPACGPTLTIIDHEGKEVKEKPKELLKKGYILAVKGLGGFHLACDALNPQSVQRLRQLKKRDYKPFALMASNLNIVREYCHLSVLEEEQLVSPVRPIVILKQKKQLPKEVNDNLGTLGVMLPYTPLHWLLFDKEMPLLVMTSANLSGDPLVWDNRQAQVKLNKLADFFVLHNRKIVNPCDDSVGQVVAGSFQLMRRARGYVPLPLNISNRIATPLLAVGGDLKNSFALAKDDKVFLSQHLGDLDNYLNMEQLELAYERMKHLTGITPQGIITDYHPNYQSTRWGKALALKEHISAVPVQHHHAHLVSCMIDNNLTDSVLGIICDGTGYGLDGQIWGCEFLVGNMADFERLGHLEYMPLPGGDVSIQRPMRLAYSYIWQKLGQKGLKLAEPFLHKLSAAEQQILSAQLTKKINTVSTSSAGRLFDAISSLVMDITQVQYEAQAAMRLEAEATPWVKKVVKQQKAYDFSLARDEKKFILETGCIWEQVLMDLKNNCSSGIIAAKFHLGFAQGMLLGAEEMKKNTGLKQVVLSGGVFQNKLLTQLTVELLTQGGFIVYTHKNIPPNDGGIGLGQIYIGNEVLNSCV